MGASSARQLRATRETNAQNYQIYQESKDFAREQANTQWQRELEMFDKENEYNNPVNVVGRLRDAGINPSLAMQGSLGSAMSSAASGGSPQMGASPTPPQMQVPDYLGADQMLLNAATGVSDSMLKATEMLKNVASAKQVGIDTTYLEQTLNSRVKQTQSESEYARMQASLYKQFGFDRTVKELNKLDKECRKLDADADNAILDGDYKKAQTSLTKLLQQKQIKENEWYTSYIDTKKKYVDRFVKAEVEGSEADVKVKEETAKAIPTQAAAQLLSAKAGMLSANASDYLAHHPNDLTNVLAKVIEGYTGDPESFGKQLQDKGIISVFSQMSSSEIDRFTGQIAEKFDMPKSVVKRGFNIANPIGSLIELLSNHTDYQNAVLDWQRKHSKK